MRTFKGEIESSNHKVEESKLRRFAFNTMKKAKEGLMIVMIPMVMATGFTNNVYGDENMSNNEGLLQYRENKPLSPGSILEEIKAKIANNKANQKMFKEMNETSLYIMISVISNNKFKLNEKKEILKHLNIDKEFSFSKIYEIAQKNNDLKEVWGKNYNANMKKLKEITDKYPTVELSDLEDQNKEMIVFAQLLFIATYDKNLNDNGRGEDIRKKMAEKFGVIDSVRNDKEDVNELDSLIAAIGYYKTNEENPSLTGATTIESHSKEDEVKRESFEKTKLKEGGSFGEEKTPLEEVLRGSSYAREAAESVMGEEEWNEIYDGDNNRIKPGGLDGLSRDQIEKIRDEMVNKLDEPKSKSEQEKLERTIEQVNEYLDNMEEGEIYSSQTTKKTHKVGANLRLGLGGQWTTPYGTVWRTGGGVSLRGEGLIGDQDYKLKENLYFGTDIYGGVSIPVNKNKSTYIDFGVYGSLESNLLDKKDKDYILNFGTYAGITNITKKGYEHSIYLDASSQTVNFENLDVFSPSLNYKLNKNDIGFIIGAGVSFAEDYKSLDTLLGINIKDISVSAQWSGKTDDFNKYKLRFDAKYTFELPKGFEVGVGAFYEVGEE